MAEKASQAEVGQGSPSAVHAKCFSAWFEVATHRLRHVDCVYADYKSNHSEEKVDC